MISMAMSEHHVRLPDGAADQAPHRLHDSPVAAIPNTGVNNDNPANVDSDDRIGAALEEVEPPPKLPKALRHGPAPTPSLAARGTGPEKERFIAWPPYAGPAPINPRRAAPGRDGVAPGS